MSNNIFHHKYDELGSKTLSRSHHEDEPTEDKMEAIQLVKNDHEEELPPAEVPLLTTFMCKYSIAVGVQIIAIVDLICCVAWFTLIWTEISDWFIYLTYFCLSVSRVFFFYRLQQGDTLKGRRQLYTSHTVSAFTFVILFFAHIFHSWIKYDRFPIGFFLWQTVAIFLIVYFLLVVR